MSKVVYRKNGGRRRVGYPLLVLCAVLLFGFSLVNIVWPKRTQLELENRKAAQLPASGTGPAGTLLPGAFTTLCCSRLKKTSC